MLALGARGSLWGWRRLESRGVLLCAGVTVAGCGLGGGTLPVVFAGAERPGFKMLRPSATAKACGATALGWRDEEPGLLEVALAELVASNKEADTIRDVRVSWRGVDLLVTQIGCVTVRGDVGRTISTVSLPMLGDHPDHGGHHQGDMLQSD